jgi:hypothetical protein
MAKILRRSEKRAGVFADVLLLFAAATSLWLGSGPAECSELLSTLTEQKYIELEAGALPEDLPKKLCPCGSGLGVLTQNGELLWLANKKEKAVSMGRGFADLACFGRDLIAATEGELLFIDGNGAARAEKIGRLPAGEKIEWIRVINGKFPLVASASWLIRFDLTGTELRQHRTVQVDGPILGIDTTKDLTLITRTGIYHFDEDLTCLWSHEWADALPPVIWDRDSVFLDVSPDNDTIWVGLNSRIDEKNTMGFVCSYDRAAGSFRFKRIFNGKIVFLGGVCGYELLSFEGDASPIQEEDYQGTSSTETAEELEGSEAVPGPKAFVMTQEGKFKKYFSTKAPVAAFYQLGAALYAVQTGGMIQVFRSCLENDLISIGYTSTIISSTARYDWNEDGYPDLIIAGRVYYGPEISERPRCVSVYVSKIPRILEIGQDLVRTGGVCECSFSTG